jgi:hypothetical protein
MIIGKIKDYLNAKPATIDYILAITFILALAYYLFGSDSPVSGVTDQQIRTDIRSTRSELDGAGQAIRDSQGITEQIKQSNSDIRQSNSSIRNEIDKGESISRNSHDLIREGKQILRNAREAEQQ